MDINKKIGNYKVEPPGLFLGRGDHPKAGMLKKRITPEMVTLNLGKDAPIPECPVPGHNWGSIVHNDEVSWLAFWKDTISDSFKYVWLSASSRIKGEADMKKFKTAQNLKECIDEIRNKYKKELKSKDIKVKQRATALYLIDHLALRVGNEKDEDEADTVGCCSLRVEHIKLKEPNIVEFDFLGKDSMRYQNIVEIDEIVFKNLKLFIHGKQERDELFEQLTTTALNAHLKSQMEGLTAKVFRTYNASITLQKELDKLEDSSNMTIAEKMLFYNRANREVAILCNHQKTISKSFSSQMGKIDEKIQELEDEKKKLEDKLEEIKTEKKRKKEDSEEEEEEENGENKKKKKKRKLPDDPEKIKKMMEKINQRIENWKTKKTEKDELKTVSLTTSKINYIDPRISVAWAKKHQVPIEKIFSKTLRMKFPWAMDVDENWKF
jgi:DNA topoisomerase-1